MTTEESKQDLLKMVAIYIKSSGTPPHRGVIHRYLWNRSRSYVDALIRALLKQKKLFVKNGFLYLENPE